MDIRTESGPDLNLSNFTGEMVFLLLPEQVLVFLELTPYNCSYVATGKKGERGTL